MNENKKKFFEIFLVIAFLVIIFCSFANAIGVGCTYSGSELPLEMYPGEEKIVYLNLQNADIEDEITLEGEVLEGNDIASLNKKNFKVSYKATNVFAELTVKIPESASIGQNYSVRYRFRQVAGGEQEGGTVSFGQVITRYFDVVLIQKTKEEQPAPEEGISIGWVILAVVLVIAVIVVVWFVIRSRREEQNLEEIA